MKPTTMRQRLLATSIICGAMAATAWADTAAGQAAAESTEVGEIVVTGSRIRRDTFNAPTALSVVTSEAIRESGQTSVGDLLLEQPNINPNTNQQNSSNTLFLAGQTRADIRGLGAPRTLVLMDGRRLPFSDASSPAVDLNTIPSLMIERVETIAGGASAVYGSEAISGVVNFIMKKEHDGLEFDATVGIAEEGDGEEGRYGFNYGRKFFDDKVSFLIGGEYASTDKILQKDREYTFPGVVRNTLVSPQTVIPRGNSNTSPFASFNLRNSNVLGTGLLVTRDVRDNGASIVRVSPECSTGTVQPVCNDPALFNSAIYNALQGKSDRAVLRTYVDYKITDSWHAFVDASYVKANGYGVFQPAFSNAAGGGTMPVVMRGDNAFLNGPGTAAATLRAIWTAPATMVVNGQTVPVPFATRGAGLTLTQASSVNIGKFWQEFGNRDVKTAREQYRVAGGFEGKFQTFGRDVNVDGYVQYSRLDGTTTSYNQPNVLRVQQATDAIVVNGQIVCRDVAARAAGCVPWDLINGASREAINWANGVSATDSKVTQTVAGLNFAADVFDLPAGPVGVAFGAEYRKETSAFAQDALGASGALFINPIGTRSGEYNVKEIYGEIRIPILKDVPFAEELSIELAARASDYSTIHGTDQYRLAATWSPVKDIRFRATQSTAVRAPNIVELFAPQSRNFTQLASDPCDAAIFAGASAAQQAARRVTCAAAIPGWNPATFQSNFGTNRPSLPLLVGGNTNLGPETAHTYEYGVVIQPRWIPGLQISVDYFKYNLANGVGTVPINTLFQGLCYDSTTPFASNPFCALIQRDPTGNNGGAVVGGVIQAILTNQNVAATKVEGYDYSVAYGFRTEDVFGQDYGDIALRLDATWNYQFTTQGLPGQAFTQLANSINNGLPEWKANGTARWSYDKYSFTWTTIYIGSVISNNAFLPNQLDPYETGDYFRHDVRATYRFSDNATFRAGVINLFDRAPPGLPETFTGTGVGASMYDNRGRFFFVGAGLTF